MEILDEDLAEDLGLQAVSPKIDKANYETRIIQQEEMPQVIKTLINRLSNIQINNISLIFRTFHNDTIIIDPKLTIDVINKSLGINENSLYDFIYNMYFYGLESILEETFGKYIFIQIPPLIFQQTGDNRFQFDF